MASIAFSIYVSNRGHYDETYGSVGAVVILMMWFYLSAIVMRRHPGRCAGPTGIEDERAV